MKSVLFVALIAVSAPAFAADPAVEMVENAFSQIVEFVSKPQENKQAKQEALACGLINEHVALGVVAEGVLGQAANSNEADAIEKFKNLLPSLIATDLMTQIDLFKFGIKIDPKPAVRGSNAKGVKMNIEISKDPLNIKKYVVVTSEIDGQLKIVDLEFTNYGKKLVNVKAEDYAVIMAEAPEAPVAHLVNTLNKSSDLIRCP